MKPWIARTRVPIPLLLRVRTSRLREAGPRCQRACWPIVKLSALTAVAVAERRDEKLRTVLSLSPKDKASE